MKKNIIYMLTILLLILGCKNDLILVVDLYNPPYNIIAVPENGGITLKFWSGILSTDFAGFNMYANTTGNFTQIDDAILNSSTSALPTVQGSDHSRSLFTVKVPGTYNNGTLYYLSVTAYGTNSLATNGYLETKISRIVKAVPRPEGTLTVANNTAIIVSGVSVANLSQGATTTGDNITLITPIAPYKMQSLGIQSNFTDVVIITNMNYSIDFDSDVNDISPNKIFVLYDNTSLVKLFITSTNDGTQTSIRWAYQANASTFNGL